MKKICIYFFITCLASVQGLGQSQWPVITKTAKPWTRWWWMGSAVDAPNIRQSLSVYASAGLGGVEIVPIYGAKGFEQRYISYLTPAWMAMLDSTVAIANRLKMGVDVAVGTGWPIGGPQVTIADAATRLQLETYKIIAGQKFTDSIRIHDPKVKAANKAVLSALMAYGPDAEVMDLTRSVNVDGVLINPPNKDLVLVAAFEVKTLQKVKRAAPGGEGYSFDHFSKNAFGNYLQKFDTAYGTTAHGVRSFFNDSYEVFNADWSPGFFAAFQQQRGYDLKLYLRELHDIGDPAMIAKIKSDYRETMAELMLNHFSAKFASWSHSKSALATNQAHGSPANLLDMYAAVDIAETETFGPTNFPIPGLRRDTEAIQKVDPDPIMSKFASSAAHMAGHQLVSCETFTWLTEHFKTSWAQCKPEVDNVFLAGINHVFFHGTTYSPADAKWPGWLFYASVNFVPANSMWPQLSGLTSYITRCQSVLQAGKPDNELAVYWPVYDTWADPKDMDKPLKVHDVHKWLQPTNFYKNVKQLQASGYSVDFISDQMIANAFVSTNGISVSNSGGMYKTLVIPACTYMPLKTLNAIVELAKKGATVVFEKLPSKLPGLKSTTEQNNFEAALRLISDKQSSNGEVIIGKGRIIINNDIRAALQQVSIFPETLTVAGLQFIRRAVNNGKYYFVVNQGALAVDTIISLQTPSKMILLMDPQTGTEAHAKVITQDGRQQFRIQLKPGSSIIIKALNQSIKAEPWKYEGGLKQTIIADPSWQVSFTAGGPTLPAARVITGLSSWTNWGDSSLKNFSGTAVYQGHFSVQQKIKAIYQLNLGTVCESAHVWINGQDAGLAWALPYRMDITRFIKPGKNIIKVEVVNLMANRIRFLDRNKISWRNYHEINFVNIKYKEFDAAAWDDQPSGLLGPVSIDVITVE